MTNNLRRNSSVYKDDDPMFIDTGPSEIDKELEFIHRIKEVEEGIEDERKSNEYFSKLDLQDITLSLLSIICMYLV